ncbi:MAG TPA: translocation/assembly module TamB domain-containing protein, partial [Acidobacteriota bacterium]
LPIHGTIDATLELKGPFAELEGRADFESPGGDFWGEKWDRGKGTVLFFPDSLGVREVTAHLNGGYIQASGDLVFESDVYNVQFNAENIPLQRLTVLKKAELEISGVGSATGGGEGTLRKPELHATLDLKNLIYRGEMYGNVAADVNLQPETLFVNATGVARGITSTVSGKISMDGNFPMEADLDIQKFPLEILTRTYAPETKQLTGLIGGKFQLRGTLRPAEIRNVSGALDLIQLDLLGVRLEQERPIDVVLSDNVIQIKDSSLVGEHARIAITGKIYPREKGRLDLNLTTNIGLEILSQWDPDITASGQSTSKVEVTGTLKQPTLTGVMDVQDGFFRHYSFPNSLTDITALISFKNRNITLQSFQANSSGGTLTAGGAATLKGYALDTYRFDIYAKEIRVHYPEGLRSTITGELHLQAKENSSYLTGDVDILQGIYTRSFEESPTLFGYARVPSIAGIGPKGTERPPMKLNILIHSEGDLLVRNNFANITSSANLNLIGTMENPVLIGRLEVNRGVITFQDRDYNVVRGSLSFSNPYRTEASLNFTAETRIREYRISLNFTGTFDRIYHDLSSDPPLPRDDIYAMLGVGRAPGELSGVDASTVL